MEIDSNHQFSSSEDLSNMKVIIAVIFAIGSVSAARSGPYLPSGWKPSGPAFYLPTEVQKPADNPLKDTLLFAPEASGSEGLREYGPPKETFTVQNLPDVVTEQTFFIIGSSDLVEQQRETEVNEEQKSEIQEATTEAQIAEFKTEEIVEDTLSTVAIEAVTDKIEAEVAEQEVTEGRTAEVEAVTEVVTEAVEVEGNVDVATDKAEIVQEVSEVKEIESTVAVVEEKLNKIVNEEQKLEEIVVQEKAQIADVVAEVDEVKNIAEAIVLVEGEVKPEEVQQNIETAGELKINEEESEVKVPEGFLEYGPPGFTEYGPPKGEELKVEQNEVRRRRFSPKFKSSVHKKH